MHTGGTAHLGNAADGILHLFGSNQHQVCQLIDDHNDLGKPLAIFLPFHNAVVGLQIPDARIRHQLIPAEHFRHCPLQRTGSLFGVRHHRNQQLGDPVVDAQFHHFGVHHDQLHILRPRLVKQADDNGVHAHGFTGAGGTGDKHMGHFRNIAHNAVTGNILAHGEGGLALGVGKGGRIDDLPKRNSGNGAVRHLNAHNGNFSGNGRDPDTGSTQAQSDVVGAGGKLTQANTLVQLHLVPGNAGAPGNVDDVGIDMKRSQSFVESGGILPHLLGAVGGRTGRTAQQVNGRETIGLLFLLLTLGNFRRHLSGGFCRLLAGNFGGYIHLGSLGSLLPR